MSNLESGSHLPEEMVQETPEEKKKRERGERRKKREELEQKFSELNLEQRFEISNHLAIKDKDARQVLFTSTVEIQIQSTAGQKEVVPRLVITFRPEVELSPKEQEHDEYQKEIIKQSKRMSATLHINHNDPLFASLSNKEKLGNFAAQVIGKFDEQYGEKLKKNPNLPVISSPDRFQFEIGAAIDKYQEAQETE